jgi:hypothetical protein
MSTDERLYRFFREHEDARPKWLFIEPDGRYRLMLACWHIFHWKDSDDVFRQGLTMALLEWCCTRCDEVVGRLGPKWAALTALKGTWQRASGDADDMYMAVIELAEGVAAWRATNDD